MPFLPEGKKIEKVKKLVANLPDKTEYVILTRNVKQALNHELVLEKLHRIIKFKQKGWFKSYIDMNTDLRKKKQKLILKKILMNNEVLKKLWKMGENGDIKVLTTERRRNYLVSEPNYHTTIIFTENLLAIEMKKKTCEYE